METKVFDEGTCIDQLMGFTKDELRDLSAAMGVPVAAFWSKDRICRAMVQAMGENPVSTADWFSHPLLKELRDLSEYGIPAEPMILEYQAPAMAEQLLTVGLAEWRGRALMIWPMAFQIAAASDEEREKERFQVDLCAEGMLCAYGIMEEGEWVRRMTALWERWSEAQMARHLCARLELLDMTQRLVRQGRRWWADIQMDEPGQWVKWYLENQEMEYRIYSAREYRKAALTGWIREPQEKEEIIKLLTGHGMEQSQAEDALTMEMLERQNHPGREEAPGFVRHFVERHPLEGERITELYRAYCRNMALWIYKGDTAKSRD